MILGDHPAGRDALTGDERWGHPNLYPALEYARNRHFTRLVLHLKGKIAYPARTAGHHAISTEMTINRGSLTYAGAIASASPSRQRAHLIGTGIYACWYTLASCISHSSSLPNNRPRYFTTSAYSSSSCIVHPRIKCLHDLCKVRNLTLLPS